MIETSPPFELEWYERDPHELARALLGQILTSELGGTQVHGRIVEVEVYGGAPDPACHADRGHPTARTQTMFGPPGMAYVYRIYGMYDCLNVVATASENGKVSAILVRALEPLGGLEVVRERRGTDRLRNLTSGPGKLCQALAVTREQDGHPLTQSPLWISPGVHIEDSAIATSARAGLNEKTCGASTARVSRHPACV
jgi:DNA-3-methyladenine glycosylase